MNESSASAPLRERRVIFLDHLKPRGRLAKGWSAAMEGDRLGLRSHSPPGLLRSPFARAT